MCSLDRLAHELFLLIIHRIEGCRKVVMFYMMLIPFIIRAKGEMMMRNTSRSRDGFEWQKSFVWIR